MMTINKIKTIINELNACKIRHCSFKVRTDPISGTGKMRLTIKGLTFRLTNEHVGLDAVALNHLKAGTAAMVPCIVELVSKDMNECWNAPNRESVAFKLEIDGANITAPATKPEGGGANVLVINDFDIIGYLETKMAIILSNN